jgi:hypothetical protein
MLSFFSLSQGDVCWFNNNFYYRSVHFFFFFFLTSSKLLPLSISSVTQVTINFNCSTYWGDFQGISTGANPCQYVMNFATSFACPPSGGSSTGSNSPTSSYSTGSLEPSSSTGSPFPPSGPCYYQDRNLALTRQSYYDYSYYLGNYYYMFNPCGQTLMSSCAVLNGGLCKFFNNGTLNYKLMSWTNPVFSFIDNNSSLGLFGLT